MILLVEDELSIAQPVLYNLEKAGYETVHCTDGGKALKIALTGSFDLIILDVMLPTLDGFAVLEKLRVHSVLTPVLMLTALSDTKSRVHGIRGGADDYLGKPFELEELLARVEALLRRRNWVAAQSATAPSIVRIGKLVFDRGAHTLSAEKKPDSKTTLTAVESKLLSVLVEQATSADAQRVIPRAELLAKVWGLKEDTQTRTLDMFVARLRQLFVNLGDAQTKIEALRGVGYRLNIQK